MVDITKTYLSPNETSPIKSSGVVRQILEYLNYLTASVFITSSTSTGTPTGLFGLQNYFTGIVNGGGVWTLGCFALGANVAAGGIEYVKTRGSTPSSHVAVQVGDRLMDLEIGGSDGTQYTEGCSIHAWVDRPVGTGSVPARWTFHSLTSTSTLNQTSETMRLDSVGNVSFNQGGILNLPGAAFNVTYSPGPNLAIWEGYSAGNGGNNATFYRYSATDNIGSQALIGPGTILGKWRFQGSDGLGFKDAAQFVIAADGTPANHSMPGLFAFYTTPNGSTTVGECLRLDNGANVLTGPTTGLAPNATDGFLHIATTTSSPTGTPTASTGHAPMVYDKGNNKLWFYNTAWKSATFT